MIRIIFFITKIIRFFCSVFYFFLLEIPVIRIAEYKLSIITEICTCMFNLHIKKKIVIIIVCNKGLRSSL